MPSESDEKVHKKRSKKGKKSKAISFDEEVVPKDVAQEILARETVQELDKSCEKNTRKSGDITLKKSKKRKREKGIKQSNSNFEFTSEVQSNEVLQSEIISEENDSEERKSKKKKKKRNREDLSDIMNDKLHVEDEMVSNEKPRKKKQKKSEKQEGIIQNDAHSNEEDGVVDSEKPVKKKKKKKHNDETEKQEGGEEQKTNTTESKKEESIRERKRKKYAQLLKEKKSKTELALQEKSLNYLSKWKHTRNEWKFEKLRQIWLQQNMYDSAKLPTEFWETLLEYFGNSKGKAREIILKDAVKIIEDGANSEEKSAKCERARDVIQNLQE